MPRLSMQIPHALGREEAARRLKAQINRGRSKVSDLEEDWQGDTLNFKFKAMGFKVGGAMAVEDAAVKIDVDLPFAAMMVKGMIEQRARQELGGILA